MALDPLATVDDLRARNIPEDDQDDIALRVASGLVRLAAENCISQKTSTITLPAPTSGFLALPGPVTAVAAVTVNGRLWDPTTDFYVSAEGITAAYGWDWCDRPVNVTITFTHGLAEIPDDIVDLVCALAVMWKQAHADGFVVEAPGVESMRVDDYSETRSPEALDQIEPVWIPDKKKRELQARFNGGLVTETA